MFDPHQLTPCGLQTTMTAMNEKEKSDALGVLDRLADSLPARGRVWIIPHDYPDPDALASAAAMHLLLTVRYKLKPLIAYSGEVTRSENREMVRHIPYQLAKTSSLRSQRREIPTIYVDTAPWAGNVSQPESSKTIAVFDHHAIPKARQNRQTVPVVAVLPDVGATATIVSDLLEAAEVSVPSWLATILVYAIATETLDLHRETTTRDLNAYMLRITQSNLGALGKIRHAPLPRQYFGFLQESMSRAKVYGRIAWTTLADVDKPEIVAEIADLLLRMERITWSFCMAGRGDRLLVSIRSCQPGAHCGKLLTRVIGRQGRAGGHGSMAAGYVHIGPDTSVDDVASALAQRTIRQIEIRRRKSVGDLDPEGQPLINPSPEL